MKKQECITHKHEKKSVNENRTEMAELMELACEYQNNYYKYVKRKLE